MCADDEKLLVAELIPIEFGPFGSRHALLPLLTQPFLHIPNRVFHRRTLYLFVFASPMRSQCAPRPLLKLAGQFSAWVHEKRIYIRLYSHSLGCLFDFVGAEVGRRLVLGPATHEEVALFFLLLLVVEAAVHGVWLEVVLLVQFLRIILQIWVKIKVPLTCLRVLSKSR